MKKPFIIADIGSNWKRSDDAQKNRELALEQIYAAKDCGVDAVKFQYFTHEELYGFPGDNTYSLPTEWIPVLKKACDKLKIEFMCTAFSPKGLDYINKFVKIHKLASSELLHTEMLQRFVKYKKPVIVSTGGATHKEVYFAKSKLSSLKYCYFLECVASYPSLTTDYNLTPSIPIKPRWGISDHTLETDLALIAVGRGATIFEKHYDCKYYLFDNLPDSPVSLGSMELTEYCKAIHEAYHTISQGLKEVQASEIDMVKKHKRRFIATAPIKKGDNLIEGVNFGIYRSKKESTYKAPLEIKAGKADKDYAIGEVCVK